MHLCQLDRKPDSWFVRYRTLTENGNIFYTHRVTAGVLGSQVHIARFGYRILYRWHVLPAKLFQ
jgi:hypothetical protein